MSELFHPLVHSLVKSSQGWGRLTRSPELYPGLPAAWASCRVGFLQGPGTWFICCFPRCSSREHYGTLTSQAVGLAWIVGKPGRRALRALCQLSGIPRHAKRDTPGGRHLPGSPSPRHQQFPCSTGAKASFPRQSKPGQTYDGWGPGGPGTGLQSSRWTQCNLRPGEWTGPRGQRSLTRREEWTQRLTWWHWNHGKGGDGHRGQVEVIMLAAGEVCTWTS